LGSEEREEKWEAERRRVKIEKKEGKQRRDESQMGRDEEDQ